MTSSTAAISVPPSLSIFLRRSCPAGTCALDLDEGWAGLQQRLGSTFETWVDLIDRRLGFADASRSRSFAGLMLTAIEGAYVRGRAERSSAAFREAGEWLAAIAAANGAPVGQARPVQSRTARRAAVRVKK